MNKRFILVTLFAVAGFMMSACVPTKQAMSPMQKRQITTRVVKGNYQNTFRGLLTVFQDHGYIVKEADMDSGLVRAEIRKENSGFGSVLVAIGNSDNSSYDKATVYEASATVSELAKTDIEVRLTIQEKSVNNHGNVTTGRQIYDVETFQTIFNDLQIEVKRREAYGR